MESAHDAFYGLRNLMQRALHAMAKTAGNVTKSLALVICASLSNAPREPAGTLLMQSASDLSGSATNAANGVSAAGIFP
jgi:hypothetical protein